MLENRFTLVRNFNFMLRKTDTKANSYLIKQLPTATAFINQKFEIVYASDKWIEDFDFSERNVFKYSPT